MQENIFIRLFLIVLYAIRKLTFLALTQSTFNFAILNGLSKSLREVGNCEESTYLALFASAEYLFSPAPARTSNRHKLVDRINCAFRNIIFIKRYSCMSHAIQVKLTIALLSRDARVGLCPTFN